MALDMCHCSVLFCCEQVMNCLVGCENANHWSLQQQPSQKPLPVFFFVFFWDFKRETISFLVLLQLTRKPTGYGIWRLSLTKIDEQGFGIEILAIQPWEVNICEMKCFS